MLPTPLQEITNTAIELAGIRLYIKRDDLIHPTVSGNKWRKLKYNLAEAEAVQAKALLTFGGAYSNHLYATAAAGHLLGIPTIGIVRGEDFTTRETPTLKFCREQQMTLHFVSREEYRLSHSGTYLAKFREKFNDPFIIPEGGTSSLALLGVKEMIEETVAQLGFFPDFYAVPAGTGGTAAGMLSTGANVLAFAALKGGHFLEKDISQLLTDQRQAGKLTLFTTYHFGGYARWTPELMQFVNMFKNSFCIQLEQVYTGKMFFGLFELINQGYFKKGTSIVAVHTGGLQGLRRD